ncbi:MAG: hypothetical protein AB1540_17610, partial [Bdellovibrionota bacterium]
EVLLGKSNVTFAFFYPFVSERPCLKWGLPAKFSQFERLVRHALTEAKKFRAKTQILSVHQGEWEAEIARSVYLKQGFEFSEQIILAHEFSQLWPSFYDVHVFSCVYNEGHEQYRA